MSPTFGFVMELIFSVLQGLTFLVATHVFLKQDIKNNISKILIYSIVWGLLTTITFKVLYIEVLRLSVNVVISLILVKYIFNKSWWNTVSIAIIFVFFQTLLQTISVLLILYVFKLSFFQVMNDVSTKFKFFLPLDFFAIIIAFGLKRLRNCIVVLFIRIRMYKNSSLLSSVTMAVFLQSALLVSLLDDYLDNITYSENPVRVSLIIGINFLIIGLSVFILFKTIYETEQKMVSSWNSAMVDNVYSLLNSVKSQRHDFINHVQVINSLIHTQDPEALGDYIKQLTNNITTINNLLSIDNPIIGALLNSQKTIAELKGIDFQVNIYTSLSNISAIAFDLTRILGNLINNAMEDIEQHNRAKWINILIKEKGPFLTISVTNPGSPAIEKVESLFEAGYTTKGENHGGLGLFICKQLTNKLHGKLDCKIIPGSQTTFSLILPRY